MDRLQEKYQKKGSGENEWKDRIRRWVQTTYQDIYTAQLRAYRVVLEKIKLRLRKEDSNNGGGRNQLIDREFM